MKVGVPKETASGERRVALVPDSTKRLAEAGVEVLVESGAGEAAGFLDKAYEEKSVAEVLDSPVAALSGVSEGDAEKLEAAFGIKTVRDLGTNKYFRWAQGIVALAD